MATVFRWLLRIVSGVLLLSVAIVLVVYYLGARSLVDYDANYTLQGIDGEIEIVRDTSSVPHVFADADHDVFFGLGFAHAQDRLWQMTMLRRTAQGRLSELFGRRTLKIDELMRRLDLYPLSVQSERALDSDTLAVLQAYSDGVNAWLNTVNEQALGRGAPELFLFSNEIAPWQPADSIALLKLMALQLSGHLEEEILRARTSLLLSEDRLRDVLPDAPGTGLAALPEFAALFPTAPKYAASTTTYDPLSPSKPRGFAGASNAWAAAPKRSAAGGALLANDPHLGFSAPAIWYLARIELASGGIIGGTIPGIPTVLVGRSADLGWGLTSSYMDDQDVYIERLNPENPDEYQTSEGFKAFQTRSSIIRIKDELPETITLRWTDNGPVLPGHHFNLGPITPAGHVTTLAWTALSPNDTSIAAAIKMMQSKSIEAAIEAGEDFIAPSQNLSLAEPGRVAMKTIGAMPLRSVRHQTQGRMPSPGWISTNQWQGRANYAANPTFIDPEGGILGNTNNKTVDKPFPFHVSFEWGDTQRVQRWQRLMQNREVHTRESFIEAQLDTVSFTARALLPLVAKDLWFTGESAPDGSAEQRRKRALDLLAEWNGEMNEHLPEPLIHAAWLRFLQDRLIRDDLGPLAAEYPHVDPVFIERVFRDTDGAAAWCNVVQSTKTETCIEMARLALDDALIWLQERYGTALESLRWGDVHQATHDHQVMGNIPLLSILVNIRQSTSGGDNTLMRGRTSGKDPDPYLNVHGAGYRGVYDFSDPDSSVFIISTGQSGHPLSRHYDDLGEIWRRGEYIPMTLDPDLARAAAEGVTVLTPAR